MQLEQEILLVLQTQRNCIARDWQAACRALWHGKSRSEFGRGSDAFHVVMSTLACLEQRFRAASALAGYSSPLTSQQPGSLDRILVASPDSSATLIKETASSSCKTTATAFSNPLEIAGNRWADLPDDWVEVSSMLSQLGSVVQNVMEREGVNREGTLLCAVEITTISAAAAQSRYCRVQQELVTIRELAVMNQHMGGRFISNASHDLRTPLTAILGFSELLIEENYGELNKDQTDAVGHIYNSAQNLLEMVNNLLDVMQIQAGKLNLRCKRIDAYRMLHSVYELLEALATRRKVQFSFVVPEDLGMMNMDENIVRHIVYHLLTSSLRSTPSGGTVILSAERSVDALTIITKDTALKLPPEVMGAMMGVVPLLENSPVRGYEGWEVGLALVKRFVDLHQGTFQYDSTEQDGTTFRVSLPMGLPLANVGTHLV